MRQTGLGDDGYAVVQSYEADGRTAIGLTQIQAVRVGNALLLSTTSNEGWGDAEGINAAVRDEEATLAPVADAMCMFAAAGCGDEPTPEPEGTRRWP